MRAAAWVGTVSSSQGSDGLDTLFARLPPTLSAEEVAELLGISRATAYAWLKDGVIPGYKIGTTWRVVRDELKETMRRGANQPRRPAGGGTHTDDDQGD